MIMIEGISSFHYSSTWIQLFLPAEEHKNYATIFHFYKYF